MNSAEELSQLQLQHQLILDAAGEGIYGLDCDGSRKRQMDSGV